MGVAHWKPDVDDRGRGGHGRRSSRACRWRSTASASTSLFELFLEAQPHRRPPRPRHERPDREPRDRRQEPRHLRGARAWRCCTSPTSACSRAIHNENTLDLYFTLGRRLGRLLYEGKWFDPEAMLLKDALTRWVAPASPARSTLELRRGDDYTIARHARRVHGLRAPTSSRWRRSRSPRSRPRIASARSRCRTCRSADNRALLLHHLDSLRALGARPGGTNLGALLGEAGADDSKPADSKPAREVAFGSLGGISLRSTEARSPSPRDSGERVRERGPLLLRRRAPLPAAFGRRPLPRFRGARCSLSRRHHASEVGERGLPVSRSAPSSALATDDEPEDGE